MGHGEFLSKPAAREPLCLHTIHTTNGLFLGAWGRQTACISIPVAELLAGSWWQSLAMHMAVTQNAAFHIFCQAFWTPEVHGLGRQQCDLL